jgi:transposase
MNKEPTYVGVDISKDYLDLAIVDPNKKWRFGNSLSGIKQAIRTLKGMGPILVVFEATGGLELPFWEALTELDINAASVNPRQIRDFARAKGRLAKTDTIDAQIIAHYGQAMRPRPQPFPDTQDLKELMARRSQLVEMIVAEKNRLKAVRKSDIKQGIQEHVEWLESRLDNVNKDLKKAIEKSPILQEKDELLQSAPGVGPKIALIACMRKLLIILNSMLKNHISWSYSPR